MLASQRRHAISTLVSSRGGASVQELAAAVGTSENTLRRDLTALHKQGVLRRVHGGAVPIDAVCGAPPGPARARPYDIAHAAALAVPGSTIAVSAGPHTRTLAGALSGVGGLTVVTTSLPVAAALRAERHRQHIVVGGVSTPGGQTGSLALATLRSLHVDMLFLAVHGMDGGGFTAAAEPDAQTGRALIGAARRTVVLADHTAWSRTGGAALAHLRQADAVVSDSALPAEAQSLLTAHVGRLILADTRPAWSATRPHPHTSPSATYPPGRTPYVPPAPHPTNQR